MWLKVNFRIATSLDHIVWWVTTFMGTPSGLYFLSL